MRNKSGLEIFRSPCNEYRQLIQANEEIWRDALRRLKRFNNPQTIPLMALQPAIGFRDFNGPGCKIAGLKIRVMTSITS